MTQALFVFACVASASIWLATLATLWYQRSGYERRFGSRRALDHRPSCALIVPCKGAPAGLAKSLRAFFDLDYSSYRVIFAVESREDRAHAIIAELIAGRPEASLVVAGLATACAQMNQNLMAGVAAAGAPEVYVFADAQLRPARNWLRELLVPLSDPGVTATTGFRWPLASGGALGQYAHIQAYLLLYAVFAFACLLSNVGLWGGSMAIRRRDFDELRVADLWANTSTPDMSLSRLIVEKRKQAVLVPTCLTPSDDLIGSPSLALHWFERQCMYLKAHYTLIWALLVGPIFLLLLLQLWLPVALIVAAVTPLSFRSLGGEAALAWLIGELVNGLLFGLLGKIPGYRRYLLCLPLFRSVPILGYARTLFTRTILWSGVQYRLGRSGKVLSVARAD